MKSQTLTSRIEAELGVARRNLRACGKPEDDVDLLVLLLLKLVNSGRMDGVVTVRINQHTIKDPVIEGLRMNLARLKDELNDDKEPLVL